MLFFLGWHIRMWFVSFIHPSFKCVNCQRLSTLVIGIRKYAIHLPECRPYVDAAKTVSMCDNIDGR